MVGRRSFPFGAKGLFWGKLVLVGSVLISTLEKTQTVVALSKFPLVFQGTTIA